MESLYFCQSEITESIKKLLVNFKKDSVDRKTFDYCKRKLELLEKYWQDFQVNHEKILPFEKTNHKYFVNSEYESTKQLYLTVKGLIGQRYDELRQSSAYEQVSRAGGPSTQKAAAATPDPPTPCVSRGSSSKLDDMLHKQSVNFKAFLRAIENIELESLVDKWEFEDALQNLQNRWNAIDNLHWEIIGESEENEQYESYFTKHEQSFISMKKAINSKMWSTSHHAKATPKMDIPVFTGNYHQWVSFKDLFNEAIHKNTALSNAQKMQFLKSKIKGEAERLIQHLPISSDNYIVCWEILNHRFDNKKLIFTSHVNVFLNIPNIQQQSFSAIKKLHDITLESLHAIKNLGVDISTWDPLLVHILSQKLDSESYSEYIESLKNSRELPVLQEFFDFLENKFTSLETARRRQDIIPKNYQSSNQQASTSTPFSNNRKYHYYNKFNDSNSKPSKPMTKSLHVSGSKCPLCFEEHNLYNCEKFFEMPTAMKLKTVNNLQYCINCIYNHNGNKCYSTKRCRKCSGNHHTILHDCFAKQKPVTGVKKQVSNMNQQNDNKAYNSGNVHASQQEFNEILLATALVRVTSADSTQLVLRALIDQGSQVSLITEKAAQQLGLKREQFSGVIFGIGERDSDCKGKLNITCQSMFTNYKFQTEVLIMNNLIKNLPNKSFTKPFWSHLEHINLADPEFYTSRPVDLLLGADVYALIMLDGMIRNSNTASPLAQQTQLGWILSGGIQAFHCNVILNNISDIHQFWQIEDIQEQNEMSTEEQHCIDYYISTTKRLANGRYEVRLPLKQQASEKIGSSKNIAIAQFRNLERKFCKEEHLAQQYKQFISEYQELGHMRLATPNSKQLACFLPHHSVQRADSSTTKLRVVFNASAKTSSGYSLNDLMYKGPNLQKDLQELLLKWRIYRYAYTADIEKMYRQIFVSEEDQKLQQIVWREHTNKPIESYQLTTVTYGTKSAPFLAMMTLQRLASDEQDRFPNAAKSLREDFYTDDYVSGAHCIDEAENSIAELLTCLSSGGFSLRKWSSNEKKLLENINSSDQYSQTSFIFKTENTAKTLGLRWNPVKDEFSFQYTISVDATKLTKRILLSEISKLFDPLGWLAPFTTQLKLLFQKVWQDSEIQWSDEVSSEIKNEWVKIIENMSLINQIQIPRWLNSKRDDIIQLHGFCDASLKAYACVVYARIVSTYAASVVLVAAKTRLVPNSKTVSLPRLELCAAELLSKLFSKILTSIGSSIDHKIYAWSDSKVALSWIQGNPDKWKPFVSNRVKKITSILSSDVWHYVSTKENPADSASRGLSMPQLRENLLWWSGPAWLSDPQFEPKQEQQKYSTDEEIRKSVINVQQYDYKNSIIVDLLNRHSSFIKVNRIVAWLLRTFAPTRKQMPSYITLQELRKAKYTIIKHIQRIDFDADIYNLLHNKQLSSHSKLLNLNPFLDQSGILRVGGRLKNANISTDMKNPIIISYNGRLTELLIQQAHELTFHGGPRLTLSLLRQQYWILKGNRATKKQLRNCVICKKQEPRKLHQIMGHLPDYRSNPAPPFYHTGVDLTGFIRVKTNKGRDVKTCKGYIALFICMVTKAVHIELVSDLSSSSFIAALRRMAARRGTPKHIYSDNGTNFVGANKILQEEQIQLEHIFNDTFYKEITEMSIEWHWNCPSWPSAGGIWERSIRSLKQHLKRVIGDQALTFEEYSTLLSQIEASLNSRPLCSLSEDIDDIDFLTPGHFLTSRADLTVIETAQDARTRWYMVHKMFQDLWKRWKTEYLSQLSVRSKWLKQQRNIEVGDMVTIHDDNIPSGKWPVGRVVEVHPGKDGIIRVVTLKTKNGYVKRPVLKLSILPIAEKESSKQCQQDIKQQSNKAVVKSKRSNNYPTVYSLALTLLFFITIVIPTKASYNFTTFDHNQTLYFDPLGKMQLIHDKWKVITYYDMSPYWQGDKAVTQFTKYLDQSCDKIKNQSHCHIIILQIQHEYYELQYYNQLLLNQHFGRSRARRGLINAVGSISNTLFGILDQDFAEKYQRDIDLVRSNMNHLIQLYKNQTSVIEVEYNILKRTEATIEKQHTIINKHINYLDSVTNTLQREIDVMTIQQDFTLAALATINMIQNLKRIQDTFLDTITEIYHGQINLHLLTPNQLRAELQIVSSQLSKELALPVDNIQLNLYKIYKLLKVKARMTKEYFIFEISLPLISRDTFQIYHLIPVPIQINNSMITVKPLSKYIAINLRRDAFVLTNINDLQNCEYQEDTYLCHLQGPIINLSPEETFCEKADLLTCEMIKSSCENQWILLHDLSTYLYFCCNSYSLKIICDSELDTRQVSKAGLIRLTKQCMIKGRDITLYSYHQLENTLNLKLNALDTKLLPINHLITNFTLPVQHFESSNNEELHINDSLKQLDIAIKSMKESSAQQTENLTTHDIHHYTVSYGLVAAAVAAVLWLLWRRRRRTNTPAPLPARVESVPATVSVCVNQSEQNASVSARDLPRSDQGHSVRGSASDYSLSKKWSSLRLTKRDKSTSPIAKRQSDFFTHGSNV